MEEFSAQTPLTVGSPQEVIDRTLGFREHVGDYQRQMFLIDHAGLPLAKVHEQIDYLGDIVPVLRKEFDAMRNPGVPDAPTHAARVAARGEATTQFRVRLDDVTGGSFYEQQENDDAAVRHADQLINLLVYSVIELRNVATALIHALLTGFPSPELEAVFDQVAKADAIVAVTPAYNASYSGLFKMFFDVLPEDTLHGKPVAIGVTGGTPRHSLITEHAVRISRAGKELALLVQAAEPVREAAQDSADATVAMTT